MNKELAAISRGLLARFQAIVEMDLGLYLEYGDSVTLKGLRELVEVTQFSSLEGFIFHFVDRGGIPLEVREEFCRHLTNGETHFFRHHLQLEVLTQKLFPEAIERALAEGRGLKIWCGACSTGEEAYSLAILLKEALGPIHIPVQVLGTDLNPDFVAHASRGVYSGHTLATVPPDFMRKYFEIHGSGGYKVKGDIQRMMRFEEVNLLRLERYFLDHYSHFQKFDFFFCRNAFIHLSKDAVLKVMNEVSRVLHPDGYLFVAPSETDQVQSSSFQMVAMGNIIAFKRQGAGKVRDQVDSALSPKSFAEYRELYKEGKYSRLVELLEFDLGWLAGGPIPSSKDWVCELTLLVDSFVQLGNQKQALEWARIAQKRVPLEARLHVLLASLYCETEEWDLALEAAKEAAFLDPLNGTAQQLMGMIFARLGDKLKAQGCLKRARDLLKGASLATGTWDEGFRPVLENQDGNEGSQ